MTANPASVSYLADIGLPLIVAFLLLASSVTLTALAVEVRYCSTRLAKCAWLICGTFAVCNGLLTSQRYIVPSAYSARDPWAALTPFLLVAFSLAVAASSRKRATKPLIFTGVVAITLVSTVSPWPSTSTPGPVAFGMALEMTLRSTLLALATLVAARMGASSKSGVWMRATCVVVLAALWLGEMLSANANANRFIWPPALDRVSGAWLMCTILMLAFALTAASQDRNARDESKHHEIERLQSKVKIALNEQRAVRLQNEALTHEIAERHHAEDQLRQVAFRDAVTELPNRIAFMGELSREIVHCRDASSKRCAALLYVDIDSFKSINDMLGHRVGDQGLLELAKRLRRCMTYHDVVARLQGDEFVCLMRDLSGVDQAFRRAQRILSAIEEPLSLSGAIFTLNASIGLAEVFPEAEEAGHIVRNADTAMYKAKRLGGGRCVVFEQSMQDEAIRSLQDKSELKRAIERQEFTLFYQPIVDLKDESIYGMEALIRWEHPERGLVSPGAFIPLAEETGHICAMGAWALRQACSDFQKFSASSSRPLLLSVNVSSQQLDEPGFLDSVWSTLEETNTDPHCLQLEITESVLMRDATRIGALFQEIRAKGIRIAFDDFGTGYSSMSYLERYPIDVLKIDQSFVQRMHVSNVSRDLVRHIIQIAEATSMTTSAEGVESSEQAAALVALGCPVAQGFLYSRPVPFATMRRAIESQSGEWHTFLGSSLSHVGPAQSR